MNEIDWVCVTVAGVCGFCAARWVIWSNSLMDTARLRFKLRRGKFRGAKVGGGGGSWTCCFVFVNIRDDAHYFLFYNVLWLFSLKASTNHYAVNAKHFVSSIVKWPPSMDDYRISKSRCIASSSHTKSSLIFVAMNKQERQDRNVPLNTMRAITKQRTSKSPKPRFSKTLFDSIIFLLLALAYVVGAWSTSWNCPNNSARVWD